PRIVIVLPTLSIAAIFPLNGNPRPLLGVPLAGAFVTAVAPCNDLPKPQTTSPANTKTKIFFITPRTALPISKYLYRYPPTPLQALLMLPHPSWFVVQALASVCRAHWDHELPGL